jgi:hypothetical protein
MSTRSSSVEAVRRIVALFALSVEIVIISSVETL